MDYLDLSHFENISFPLFQLIILVALILLSLIFLAKKTKKNSISQIVENIYKNNPKGLNFQNLNIEPELKQALERYFYAGDKSQKQNILNLGKKYLK